MNNEDLIISLLRGINDNIGNVSSGINPDELIPLEPLPTPPEDTLYYRTYVDDIVYIGSSGSSGYTGADPLDNIYFNHRGEFTIENLKESLESPSAQVGVLNELITEISVPDNVNILGRVPSRNLKTIIANNVWEMSQDFKGTLWYTQKEQGPVKVGSLLFGYKGTIPAEFPVEITQDIKNINSSAFIGTEVESVILHDSIEKVGTRAFYETPFIQTFLDLPIYFGKTLYDITGTYTTDTLDIPEGIKYINVLGNNVMPYQSGTSGYDPSGDSGVGDIESRDFFNVSINRINIPSTAILTENPFVGVKDLTYLGFSQTLPTMSEYWLQGSGDSGISGSTGGVQQAYYNGTVQLFKDLLQITGTEWIDNSSIIVVWCTDGELLLEDVKLATYTTYDGSTIPGSLEYGKLIVDEDFHLASSESKLDANQLESLVFDECTIKGKPDYYGSVFDNTNVKHIDLSKVYLDNSDSSASSSIPTAKYCSLLETYLSPYEIGPSYYDAGDVIGSWVDFIYIFVPLNAFINCSSLHTITLPCNLSVISENAFKNCTSLNNIILPNTVKYIEINAFDNCQALDNLTYEGTIQEFGNIRFKGPGLRNSPMHYVGYTPLEVIHCSDGDVRILTIVKGTVTDENHTPSNALYYYNNNGQLIVSFDKNLYPILIPENAFNSMANLTSVEIPNYIASIGRGAFHGCSSLTSVTINSDFIVNKSHLESDNIRSIFGSHVTEYIIGGDVKKIGLNAFKYCNYLTSINIGNSVTSIGDGAFSGCSSLTDITIPESVTSIGNSAFSGCESLTSVTIPNSVTSIGEEAFDSCTGLTEIISLNPTPPTILSNTFLNVDKSIPLYVPDVEAYLNAEYWSEFTNIQSLPNSDYELVVNSSDESMGTVQVDVHSKFQSSVTATPNEGYRFVSWTNNGEVISTESTYTFVASENLTLVANFEAKMFTVNVAATEGGSIIDVSGQYKEYDKVVIEAVPNSEEGYYFVLWSDGSTENPRTITVTKDMFINAVFLNNNMILYTTTDLLPITINETADFGSTLIDNLYN